MSHGDRARRGAGEIYDELFNSLAQARSRLAIAIAAEAKRTPPDRLSYYRDTEESIHRWLREMRVRRQSGAPVTDGLRETLDRLRALPASEEDWKAGRVSAGPLCERLREALSLLEQGEVAGAGRS